MRMTGQFQSVGDIFSGTISAKPSEYRGIQMRSRLEVSFAKYLDRMGETWTYEPTIYGPVGRGYLPDFEIVSAVRPTFIEVKPTIAEAEQAKSKVAVIWETHPDALLIIACAEESLFYEALSGSPWGWFHERWEHA